MDRKISKQSKLLIGLAKMKEVGFMITFTQSLISKGMGLYTPMAAYALSIRSRNATSKKNSQRLNLSLCARNCNKISKQMLKLSPRNYNLNS